MDIENIQITIRSDSQTAVDGIDSMVSALERLKSNARGGVRGLATTADHLKKFSDAVNDLTIDTAKLSALSDALKGLSGIEKASGFSSTVNTLKKLPSIINDLDNVALDKFADQMERVAVAVRPLASEMQKVSDGFKAFPIRIKKLVESNSGLVASNMKTGFSFKSLLSNILNVATIRVVADAIANLAKKSSEYTETLNLFTVAMGQYANEAMAYAEKVASIMGIDPAEWMRGQGVFMTLATGFGIAGDKAAYMSKNLTQLGYDISSYYNISVEDAMQKLQSGISGELEPLRRLGYDLSQAKLEAIALSLGINKSVSSMTQAEKGMLRYQAIMTQVTQVQGDMARTLESPANQLRILQSAANQAARALGNIFVSALGKLIPYAIAFLNVIASVLNALGRLFGFTTKSSDLGLSDAASSAADIDTSLGGGASSAKEMRDYLMGIDELNVIPDTSAGGGGGGGGNIADMFDFDLSGYGFLGEGSALIQQIEESLRSALRWAEPLLEAIIWLGMSIWDFSEGVIAVVSQSNGWIVFKEGLTAARDALIEVIELLGDVLRSDTFKYLVGNVISAALYTVGVGLSIVADGIMLVVNLLRGDGKGALLELLELGLRVVSFFENVGTVIEAGFVRIFQGLAKGVNQFMASFLDMVGLDKWAEKFREGVKKVEQDIIESGQAYELQFKLNEGSLDMMLGKLNDWLGKSAEEAGTAKSSLDAFSESVNLFGENINSTQIGESVGLAISEGVSLSAEEIANKMNETGMISAAEFEASITPGVLDATTKAMDQVATTIGDSETKITSALSNMSASSAEAFGSTYGKELMSGVESALASTSDSAANTFRRYVSNMVSELSALKNEFSDIVSSARNMASNVNSAIASITPSKSISVTVKHNASAAVSEINSQLKKIGSGVSRTVKITVMGDGGVISAFADGGVIQMAHGGVIPAAANGLSVDRGQLFIAREAGPELVAGIGGGRTAVMNNDQIVESVSNGVYRAVVDAMAGQPTDNGDIVLMLGDREVYRASKRGEKSSGYSLTSNPTFA